MNLNTENEMDERIRQKFCYTVNIIELELFIHIWFIPIC